MVPIDQVERGLASYMDSQLMPKLPRNSVYKIIIGASASILVKRAGSAITNLKSNPFVSAMGLIDDDGCIDIDIILDEVRNQMPPEGMKFESNKFGKLDLIITGQDVDDLHRYIERS